MKRQTDGRGAPRCQKYGKRRDHSLSVTMGQSIDPLGREEKSIGWADERSFSAKKRGGVTCAPERNTVDFDYKKGEG